MLQAAANALEDPPEVDRKALLLKTPESHNTWRNQAVIDLEVLPQLAGFLSAARFCAHSWRKKGILGLTQDLESYNVN